MADLSERDIENLCEIFDGFGLGEAITSGHLAHTTFDSSELAEAVKKASEGASAIREIYDRM